MKLIFFFSVFLFSSIWIQNLHAQQDENFLKEFRFSKSIHQVELEKYRDYKAKEAMPEFKGQPMPLIEGSAPPSREVFGYLPYWTYQSHQNLNYDLLTTIAYFGAEINEFGNIVNSYNWPAASLINLAHSQGVRVVLTVILFNSSDLATLLSNSSYRTNLINNLLNTVQNAEADGVSIDFEGVPSGQRQNLTTFMTDLTHTFHTNLPGSYITIFTPAVDWSGVFDYQTLAQVTDGLIMQGYDFHWRTSPTAGPTAPLTSGSVWGTYNVTWTVNDYLTKTSQNVSKLILSVPFFGFEWETVDDNLNSQTLGDATTLFYSSAYPNAMQYGRLWDQNSQTPWYKYNNGQWNQGWYDDSLSMSLKFDLVNNQDLKGVAIWALSYDGQRLELQEALANAFGSTASPLKPVRFRVINKGDSDVEVIVDPSSGATGYRLYTSTDGETFDAGTSYPNSSIFLNNLSTDTTFYFKLSAINGNGESSLTEVLAVHPSISTAGLLIVNGFDRTSGTVNTFDYIKRFAPSAVNAGHRFDSCSNEAVEEGDVSLPDYEAVLWISGEEGTADQSFSNTEQILISTYLESGGNLFISGSEIGYDLVGQGSSSNQQFYRNYFKAEYVVDQVPTYTVSGTPNGIFASLVNMTFDNGTHGTYNVDYPDGIKPIDGSIQNMTYNSFPASTFGGAGIHYQGAFGLSTVPGKIVYLGVPFETFYPASVRDSIMSKVLEFFDITTGLPPITDTATLTDGFQLYQNYPNPFNPSTTIVYTSTNNKSIHTNLTIYDLLGREIITLVDDIQNAGKYEVIWNGQDNSGRQVSSGVYIYRLQVGDGVKIKKMTLLK
jgi:spore germination protein YaaH